MCNHKSGCLCVVAFAVTGGLLLGVTYLVLGWTAWHYGYGTQTVQLLGTLYHGVEPTFVGGLWGGLFGFIDGFVYAGLFAWIYNFICRKCGCVKDEEVKK